MSTAPIKFTTRILRKQDDLPRYLVIQPDLLDVRDAAFAADVSLNGCPSFERNIRPWGKGSDVFFLNLTAAQCMKAGVDTGDVCDVVITPHGAA